MPASTSTQSVLPEVNVTIDVAETGSVTESGVGSHSDVQLRACMDVVCILDTHYQEHLLHRKKALQDIKQACILAHANFHQIQFEKLDFGETNVLTTFYNADVALVDLSIQLQQSALFYHLGVRESFGMKENWLLYNDMDAEATLRLKLSCGNYTFISYRLAECGACLLTYPGGDRLDKESLEPLTFKLRKLLQEVEVQSKNEYFVDLALKGKHDIVSNTI